MNLRACRQRRTQHAISTTILSKRVSKLLASPGRRERQRYRRKSVGDIPMAWDDDLACDVSLACVAMMLVPEKRKRHPYICHKPLPVHLFGTIDHYGHGPQAQSFSDHYQPHT